MSENMPEKDVRRHVRRNVNRNVRKKSEKNVRRGRLRLRYEVRIDPLFSDRGIANLVVSKLAVTRKLPSKLLTLTLSEVNFILLTWPNRVRACFDSLQRFCCFALVMSLTNLHLSYGPNNL